MQISFAGKNAWITALILLFPAHAALAQIVSVSKLSCTPGSLTSGATATCTVTLNSAAPSGGIEVLLSSNNSVLKLSGNSVTIPAAATSTTFTAAAGTVPSNQTVTVTATALNSVFLRWTASSSTNITNYKIYRGVTSGGPYSVLSTVGLVTNYTDYNVQNGNNYYYVTTAVSSSGGESAYSGQASAAVPAGISQTATLSLVASTTSTSLSSLACTPATLYSGTKATCTVTLNNAAPANGSTVSLSSSNALLPVAGSVTVPGGSTSAMFTATAGSIGANQSATLTATLNGVSHTATVNLWAPVTLSSLACSPATLSSGSAATCTVTLSNTAPAGGIVVSLASNTTLLPVPAGSITVPAGSNSATFTATAGTVTTSQSAMLTATLSGVSRTASIALSAAVSVAINSLTCSSLTLASDSLAWCLVKLNNVAPAGGLTVALKSNTKLLWTPPAVAIPQGLPLAIFVVFSQTVTQDQTATITASLNSSSASVSLNLTQ